jgi:hypothetical protein
MISVKIALKMGLQPVSVDYTIFWGTFVFRSQVWIKEEIQKYF